MEKSLTVNYIFKSFRKDQSTYIKWLPLSQAILKGGKKNTVGMLTTNTKLKPELIRSEIYIFHLNEELKYIQGFYSSYT